MKIHEVQAGWSGLPTQPKDPPEPQTIELTSDVAEEWITSICYAGHMCEECPAWSRCNSKPGDCGAAEAIICALGGGE